MTFMEPDPQLIARLKVGDPHAFDEVYAAYHARIFNFLARLSRRRDVAEDLVEEMWLRVVSHAPRLREDTQLGAWLFTIARNLFASYCRSRHLNYDVSSGPHLWPFPPADPSPFEAAAAGQLQQRVEAAMGTLPGQYREVLLLVAIEGLTPSEAAVVCGVTPEAMRQRLSRARALLARRLEDAAPVAVRELREVLP